MMAQLLAFWHLLGGALGGFAHGPQTLAQLCRSLQQKKKVPSACRFAKGHTCNCDIRRNRILL